MKSARVLEHYARVADAPDAVARLRRFILNLAVRGKLEPQNQSDEPASALLKKISQEKARLVKAGEIRPLKIFKLPERAIGTMPQGWEMVTLGTVINKNLGGGTPSKGNSAYWDGDVRWASVKDVGKSKFIDDTKTL